MKSINVNWPTGKWWPGKPTSNRRRFRSSACPVSPAQVELLERRCLPSITSAFSAGALNVVSNGADPIILGTDKSGDTTLNGSRLLAKDGSPLTASSLTSLTVTGGPSNDVIDLSRVTLAAFTSLTQVNVEGGAGDDLIIGSEFTNNIANQTGNDTVNGSVGNETLTGRLNLIVVPFVAGTPTSNPIAGQATGNGTSATGSTPVPSHVANDPTEADPKDTTEDRELGHFHWQKEPTPTNAHNTTSNGIPTVFDARVVLASLSSLDLNAQALSRFEMRLRNLSGNFETAKSEQSDGLIDISDKQTSGLVKRSASDIRTAESPASSEGIPLIAVRVAMPSRRTQLRSTQPARDVPVIFTANGEGGFIELLATTANQTPETPNGQARPSHLRRHDQVDAEIGRFNAFEQADAPASGVRSVAPPKRIAPADSHEATNSDPGETSPQVTWGAMLSAGIAIALWPPRGRTRRMVQTLLRSLGTRCRRAARVFTAR